MNTNLMKVSLRQGAIFIPQESIVAKGLGMSDNTMLFLSNIRKLGYTVSEDLLEALDTINPNQKLRIYEFLCEVKGTKLNWAPLVKGWQTPTGETRMDMLLTAFANALKITKGARLQCGHIIPENTFPLERYNGCPFCGTPFEFGRIENYGQASKLTTLELWTEEQVNKFFKDLLESKTALDATQVDSLKLLIGELPLPTAEVQMKETIMVLVDAMVEKGEVEKVQHYLAAPDDILRYLWYKKTGFLQIVEPKVIENRIVLNSKHITPILDQSGAAKLGAKAALKLKYTRAECRMVANWLNAMPIKAEKACEMMHPKRGMWVRFIRALRLAEYSKKKGFENLNELMDVFYNQAYSVWQGDVERNKLRMDADKTFALLKQRPGMFARSLFANMLWFGADVTLAAFAEVIDTIPARLVMTLNMYAENYFDPTQKRTVNPLGGTSKTVEANKLLSLYSEKELQDMIKKIQSMSLDSMSRRFARVESKSKTMYIDAALYAIPLAIGDRNETIQDTSCALMGTRFAVEGDAVRLFMQWGKGLPAQHLDMDLSAHIAFDKRMNNNQNKVEVCSYYNLVATGAKHSGDIRSIPDQIGTAEYVELNITELQKANAQYVAFTGNAYSGGALSEGVVIGWMDSKYSMKVSDKTGVAYDPSCVQHQVRLTQSLTKGLVFGVLDVPARQIIWLEMPFQGQMVANMNAEGLEALMKKLAAKTSIGELLEIKARAQNIKIVDDVEADESYSMQWAMNAAAVTKLLVD